MISAILSKIGLPILVRIVADSLARLDNPVARSAGNALKDVEKIFENGDISHEKLVEANRHIETMTGLQSEASARTLSEINKSLRAEIASEDPYVRRMRPTFGYLMAFTWAAQMFGIAYVIVFDTEKSVFVMNAMASLSAIWGVGLSVLGIYVYKRSEEKTTRTEGEKIGWRVRSEESR